MFDPLLTCKVFGVAGGPDNWHLDIARIWSHQPKLGASTDGSIQWDSETAIEVGSEMWYTAPDPVRFCAHHVLIQVGSIGDTSAFALVSPISIYPRSFKNSVQTYYPDIKLYNLRVKLDEVANPKNFVVRGLEGVNENNFFISLKVDGAHYKNGMEVIPKLKQLHAIEIDASGRTAKVDMDYNVSIADVSEEFSEICTSLRQLFQSLHHLTTVEMTHSLSA